MGEEPSATWSKAGFALLIAAASADAFYKYSGFGGIVGYTILCIAAVFALTRNGLGVRLLRRVSEKQAGWLAAISFSVLIAVSLAIYPFADSGRLGDRGSDADDALIIGAQALVHGQYPFYPRTYYGNPIAPMPGSIILAIPFAAKPLIVLQNFFWLAILLWIAARQLGSWRLGLLLVGTLIFFCPVVVQNLLTATDRISNTIYVLTGMWLTVRYLSKGGRLTWKSMLAMIFLGVTLSSRSNFLFLMPVFFSFLGQNFGWRRAVGYSAVVGLAFLAVTLPFWIYDPAGFTPFSVQSSKMNDFNATLPHASIVLSSLGMLASLALSMRNMRANWPAFLLGCGLVQMFSILLMSTVSSINLGRPDIYMGHVSYGVFALVFLLFAGVASLDLNALDRSARPARP